MLLRNRMARYQAPEGEGAGGTGGSGGEGGQGDGGSGTGAGGEGASGNRNTLLGGGGNQGDGAGAGGQGSGEGAAGAGDGGAGETVTGTGEWYWSDGNKGEGEAPPWFKADKYKTVDAQARAAVELEQKLGPAAELIGAPEGGTYEIPAAPEGLSGQFDPEDPLLSGFQKVAGELNLSQAAHDKIVQYMGGVIAEQNAADEQKLSDALGALGENVDARVNAVDQYLQKTVGEEGYNALQQAIGNDPAAFRALEQIVGKAAGDAQLAGGTGVGGPAFTRADVEAEQYKVFPEGHKLAGQKMYDHDKAHRERVDTMWKQLYPGQDRQQVG